jgi:hypothetical protein
MSKRVAIFQSNYIPWKGFFDLIRSVDEFILDDEVQYTKQSWRNRNRIKSPRGLHWLTIPIHAPHAARISDVVVAEPNWGEKHWRMLRSSYARAPYFAQVGPEIHQWYRTATMPRLSEINAHFLRRICEWLEIPTPLTPVTDFLPAEVPVDRNQRIIAICRQAKATRLLNGPSASLHMDHRQFAESGLPVDYADYSNYPPYPQLHGPFEHAVSILDLLLHVGPESKRYVRPFP